MNEYKNMLSVYKINHKNLFSKMEEEKSHFSLFNDMSQCPRNIIARNPQTKTGFCCTESHCHDYKKTSQHINRMNITNISVNQHNEIPRNILYQSFCPCTSAYKSHFPRLTRIESNT